MYIFFFFFIFILVILVSVVLFVLRVIGSVFKFRFRSSGNKTNNKNQTAYNTTPRSHSKVFDKNEGEYVDFEEIKD